MRYCVSLCMAIGLLLSTSTMALAVDITAKGLMEFVGAWAPAPPFALNNQSKDDTFGVQQRFMAQIDIVASESLSGVAAFEINNWWGRSDTAAGIGAGGGLGADGVSIQVKNLFLDWIMPSTDIRARIGIQSVLLPGFVFGSSVLDDVVAGITLSTPLSEYAGLTVWWLRPYANNGENQPNQPAQRWDTWDLVGASLPLTFDGGQLTPWGSYGRMGRDTPMILGNDNAMVPAVAIQSDKTLDNSASTWWAGLTGELTAYDPLRLAFDANYGKQDGFATYMNRSGWMLAALAEYKLDTMRPGLFAWYASGDDADLHNGSERMPFISPFWTASSYGYGAYSADCGYKAEAFGSNPMGTWAIGAQLADMKFFEKLSHTLRVIYYRGTNDPAAARNALANPADRMAWGHFKSDRDGNPVYGIYLTDKDSAWEVNLDQRYDIYENLWATLELGFIRLNLDEAVWGMNNTGLDYDRDGYRVAVTLRYNF